MKGTAKITSKGQVTVPRAFRQVLGVGAGDSLLFETRGDDVHISPHRPASPFAKFRGCGILEVGAGREAVLRAVRELRGEE